MVEWVWCMGVFTGILVVELGRNNEGVVGVG